MTGGQPPVSFVSFWCGNIAEDSLDTTATDDGVTTVTSNVTFDRLNSATNGTVCRCYAQWDDGKSLYTTTATATITVIGVYLKLNKQYNIYQHVAYVNQISVCSLCKSNINI